MRARWKLRKRQVTYLYQTAKKTLQIAAQGRGGGTRGSAHRR